VRVELLPHLDPADEVRSQDGHVQDLDRAGEPALVGIEVHVTSARRAYVIRRELPLRGGPPGAPHGAAIGGGTGGGSAVPQRTQFLQPASTGSRHCGQATRTRVPQLAQ
jgi:hypothetical protein